MSKAGAYVPELQSMLAAVDASSEPIEPYMLDRSGLPGPRGNLELADAFAAAAGPLAARPRIWSLLEHWLNLDANVAPVGDAHEFLPFCALQAMAVAYRAAGGDRQAGIERLLREAANDTRWRLREASAMGLQRIGEHDRVAMLAIVERWAAGATLLEERAIVAALAHPPILDEATTSVAIEQSRRILARVDSTDRATRRSEPFRVLSQGLGYAISVFVAALPGKGFELLAEMFRSQDVAVQRILRANLGKARLTKRFPAEVAELEAIVRG